MVLLVGMVELVDTVVLGTIGNYVVMQVQVLLPTYLYIYLLGYVKLLIE
jgi:hypothetical protein